MNSELKDLIGRAMHIAYEKAAIDVGWDIQESCQVSYDDLLGSNRFCVDASVEAAAEVLAVWFEKEYDTGNYSIAELIEKLRP